LSFENSTSQKVLEILQTITKQQQCHFEEHHVVAAQAQISEVAEGEEAVDLVVVEVRNSKYSIRRAETDFYRPGWIRAKRQWSSRRCAR